MGYEYLINKDLIESITASNDKLLLLSIESFLKYLKEKYGENDCLLEKGLIGFYSVPEEYGFRTMPDKGDPKEDEAFENIEMLTEILSSNAVPYRTQTMNMSKKGVTYDQVDCVRIKKM